MGFHFRMGVCFFGRKNPHPGVRILWCFGLFFLFGVFGDIFSVVPNHDEHHGHFIG